MVDPFQILMWFTAAGAVIAAIMLFEDNWS